MTNTSELLREIQEAFECAAIAKGVTHEQGRVWMQRFAKVKEAIEQDKAQEGERPSVGDYVFATKYHDGDPADQWAVGWYDGKRNDRYYVTDNEGKQMRGNGFRRVAKISSNTGHWLLEVAPPLERCEAGTVNLWTMLKEHLMPAAVPVSELEPLLQRLCCDSQLKSTNSDPCTGPYDECAKWAKEYADELRALIVKYTKE